MRWFSKKPISLDPIPTDRDALIILAAKELPWQKTKSGGSAVSLDFSGLSGKQIKRVADILIACEQFDLIKTKHTHLGLVPVATDADLKATINKVHPGFNAHAAADRIAKQQTEENLPSGQELIERGSQKPNRLLS